MTIVSNDPSWWPTIDSNISLSYCTVAASTMMIYDFALTFGREVELIWSQHWTPMTLLYLNARYMGILFSAIMIMGTLPVISLTDMG
ncbi:hypothetical protein M405DRAFT_94016 [Rhizopogon salebrosus TDB-379]|nr:hypothetical protein M405DRAFT_94016 [Rhizopogon salebrosus TDB-379]